jgi:Cu/Ag efflux protein CusF
MVAQKLGLNLNDYVVMEVDEEAKKITLKKLELESIPS